ncbi:11411_t:CDS:2, partial [Entrophospora sp. SA101]
VYLAIEGNTLGEYNTIRNLADRAVNSALTKINDNDRKLKILEILPQKNLLEYSDPSELSRQSKEANAVLSDDSITVEKLGSRQRHHFLEPRENMKYDLPESVWKSVEEFSFQKSTARKEQSEGTYITDIIMHLLQASLEDMSNGELSYAELSLIICNNTKRSDDEIKLWRETLDGIDTLNKLVDFSGIL